MMIYDKHIPLYIQVKENVSKNIDEGIYKDMLPTEKELIDIYNVSRVTLRKAMNALEKEGKIIRRAGFGTLINTQKNEIKKFTKVKSLTNEMKELGFEDALTFSSTLSIAFADQKMINIFECESSARLYNLKRVRGVENKPIVFSDTWLNISIDLPTSKEFLFGSLYSYLIANNIWFSRFEEKIEALMPTKELRELLHLDKDSVILKRIRKGYDEYGKLIEYSISYYDSKMYHYSVELTSLKKDK